MGMLLPVFLITDCFLLTLSAETAESPAENTAALTYTMNLTMAGNRRQRHKRVAGGWKHPVGTGCLCCLRVLLRGAKAWGAGAPGAPLQESAMYQLPAVGPDSEMPHSTAKYSPPHL